MCQKEDKNNMRRMFFEHFLRLRWWKNLLFPSPCISSKKNAENLFFKKKLKYIVHKRDEKRVHCAHYFPPEGFFLLILLRSSCRVWFPRTFPKKILKPAPLFHLIVLEYYFVHWIYIRWEKHNVRFNNNNLKQFSGLFSFIFFLTERRCNDWCNWPYWI